MLQRIFLENLVLVDKSEVLLAKGFTVITGETGSGKSILLTAIGLLLGEKADSSTIRHGEQTGIIEGDFCLPETPTIASLFEEFSIDFSKKTTIRRELFSSGKSKATIGGCAIPVQFLKRLGAELIEISSQHAYLSLQEENAPQKLLDKYAKIENEVAEFSALFEKTKEAEAHLEKLIQESSLRELEMERLHAQLQEIESAKIFETDDFALFSKLREIQNSKEILDISLNVLEELDEGKEALLRRLTRLRQKTETLLPLSPHFSPCRELLETASANLKETISIFQSSLDRFAYSEEEFKRIESSLQKIDALKRKYGPTLDDIRKHQTALKNRLTLIENQEEKIETLKKEISYLRAACASRVLLIQEKRKAVIPNFEKEVLSYLHLLHMPEALLQVEITQTHRHSAGDDKIRFFLTPNTGEKRIEVKDGASGGEMARLFLAVQAVMAHLSSIPTIVFDEIDASIGGITATAVGDLLSAIGRERQVLAITHFTQVAARAKEHIALSKETTEGRTLTRIRHLSSKKELAEEHSRMVGLHKNTL